jgi:hypothetical protein
MPALAKFTITALSAAALGAAAAHAIHAQTLLPAAPDAADVRVVADWQGAFSQSFGARVLAHGDPRDAIAGQPPSYGSSLPIFDELEKTPVGNEAPED